MTGDSERPAGADRPGGTRPYRSDPGRGGPAWIARWSIRRPWWAIGAWLVFVATAVVVGGMAGTQQATDSDFAVGESGRALEIVESVELAEPASDLVLVTPAAGGWDEPAAAAAVAELGQRLGALPEVTSVGEPVPSPTEDAVLVPVTLADREPGEADAGPAGGGAGIAAVLDELAVIGADYPELRMEGVGGRSIGHGINEVVSQDLAGAGLLSVPVTLGILLVVFGALVAAGVPLLLSFSAVGASIGLWAFVSRVVPDIGTVPQVILLIGLAVGVDYSLFYLRRAREERHRNGLDAAAAVRVAAATSGRAVLVSALTSVVALAGLYLAGDAIFTALGTGVILAVAVSLVGSLTVLPALLVKLGRTVDRPRVPLLWRLTNHQRTEPRLGPALLAPALRAPRTTLVVGLVGLVALALPALGMSLKNSGVEDLPRTIPAVQAYDRLVAAFPGQGETHRVVVRAPAGQAEVVGDGLADLVAGLADDPLFAVDPPPEIRTSPDRTVSLVDIAYPDEVGSPEAEESLERLRTELLPAAVGGIPQVEYAVGGELADSVDYTAHQVQRLPWVIGFVILLTVGMMALAFRSLVVAMLAGGLTLLSVAAAFGLLTLVFQHTWAEGLLGFTSSGHLINWVPLFLFVVLFGLSMDYHVFLVSRIREEVVAGAATRDAVRTGLIRSAGVVTSAAAVMVAVFSIFATLRLVEMKMLGVGLAAAIAIDAVVVRTMLLPAVMTLLGRANWWPSRLAREPAPGSLARSRPAPRTPGAGSDWSTTGGTDSMVRSDYTRRA